MNPRYVIVGALAAVVLLAIAAGFNAMGSPATARLHRQDQRRLDDLVALDGAVRHHWRTRQRLPATLGEITQPAGADERYRDPVSGTAYEYQVLGDSTYHLCATFDTSSDDERPLLPEVSWWHPAGRHCFLRRTP